MAPAGYFALRTPLLPFAELMALADGTDGRDLAADRRLVGARLRALAARPAIREALFLASPVLDESIDHWLADPDSERGQRVERAVMRYVARMAGRPTPFGLFAGCSFGAVTPATAPRLELAGLEAYRRHSRFDGEYLTALAAGLARAHADRLELVPNPSLVRAAGEIRVTASRDDRDAGGHQLVAVEATPHLVATIERAAGGALPVALAAAIAKRDPDVSGEEACDFIGELAELQILVPRLGPPVTGAAAVDHLIADLAGPAPDVAALLREAREELAAMEREPIGLAPARYRRLAARLPAPGAPARLFQVDLVKPAPGLVLGGRLLADIERAIAVLHRLADPPGPDSLLARVRRAMAIRFEDTEVSEVPLLDLFDEDAGLFDPIESSPLTDGLVLGGAEEEARLRPRDHLLLRWIVAAADAREIELGDAELDRIAARDPLPLPDSVEAFVTAVAPSAEALARGEGQLLCHAVVGPPGVSLVSRFCREGSELVDQVRAQLRAEEAHRPDAIYAEIVHLPEGRIANVIQRPLLRSHEIPYLGTSGAPAGSQIPLADLTVSVADDRIALRSRRLGREVIPRLSCLDFEQAGAMAIYRFLVELQYQGVAADLRWRWGALERLPFLPRVRHGRLVLSLARWRLEREELAPLGGMGTAHRHRHLQELRARLSLPRLVALTDGDKLLPVDLDNPIAVDALADLLARRQLAVLTEVYPGPDELAVSGPEGTFVNELVVPFVAPAPARSPAPCRSEPRLGAPHFGLRSGWLFARIHAGPAAVDRLLRQTVPALVEEATESLAVDRWFFVRYGDPAWHLRLRLHGPPRRLAADVLPALEQALAPLLADGRILRVALDTYAPEVNRYGGPAGIEIAERLFQVDSEAALAALARLPGDDGDLRWRLALVGIDQLLDDLGLAPEDRLALATRARRRLAADLGAGPDVDRELGARFRSHRLSLESLLDGDDPDLAPTLQALGDHRRRRRALAGRLRRAETSGCLTRSIAELAPSHVHMHVNRLLRAGHLAHELCIHDFLVRLYQGRLARSRTRISSGGRKGAPTAAPALLALHGPKRGVIPTPGGGR